MRRLKTQDHDEFEKIQKDGGDVFAVLAAVMVGDTPQMAGRGFMYIDGATPRIEIHRKSCPGDCPGGEYVFFGGQQQAARKITDESFKSPERGLSAIEFARKLVEAEIQASPEEVGPPFKILAVNQDFRRDPGRTQFLLYSSASQPRSILLLTILRAAGFWFVAGGFSNDGLVIACQDSLGITIQPRR